MPFVCQIFHYYNNRLSLAFNALTVDFYLYQSRIINRASESGKHRNTQSHQTGGIQTQREYHQTVTTEHVAHIGAAL